MWKTLAREMEVTSFDVMQRWHSLTHTASRDEAIQSAIKRRNARFAKLTATDAAEATTLTGYSVEETQLHVWISGRVKTYNNTNSLLTLSQFWELLSAELNHEDSTIARVYSLCNNEGVYVSTLLETYWRKLCCKDEHSTHLVTCQPKSISDMNVVVYLSRFQHSSIHIKGGRDNLTRQSVSAWYNAHLRHKPLDVYQACDLYITKKAKSSMKSRVAMCDVHSTLLSVLLAVEVYAVGDTICPKNGTNRSETRNQDTLPPVILPNALQLHILIPPLPLPLSLACVSNVVSCLSCRATTPDVADDSSTTSANVHTSVHATLGGNGGEVDYVDPVFFSTDDSYW